MPSPLDADVLVVGAGPTGNAVAAQLASAGWDVLLVDKARFPREKTCGDAVTPRGVKALQDLGALDLVASQAHRVNGASLISPSGHSLSIPFAKYLDGWPPYTLVLPRIELDNVLREFAVSQGVRFLDDCRVIGLFENDRGAGVVARRGGKAVSLSARVVVLAVGANMGLLRETGLLTAIPPAIPAARGYWQDVDGDEDEIWFYFDGKLRLGYAWLFPTGGQQANIGLGLFHPRQLDEFHSSATLLAAFVAGYPPIRDRLQQARQIGMTKGFPIRTDFPPKQIVKNRFVLAGEACGLVNPITGEGIDLALESGMLVAEAIDTALGASRNDEAVSLQACDRALRSRFAAYFREIRWLRDIVMRPRALDILIRKGDEHPELMASIAYLSLGLASPRVVLNWKVWRDILF